MKRLKKLLIFALVVVLIVGGLVGYSYYRAQAQQIDVSTLQTTTLKTGDIAAYVDATGSVRTNQSGTLSWQASGIAGPLQVKVGDQVKAGQVLASLDPNSLPASIISAQSDLITAQQALQNLQQSATAQAQANVAVLTARQSYSNTLTAQQNLNGLSGSVPYMNALQDLTTAQGELRNAQKIYQNMPGDPSSSLAKAQAHAVVQQSLNRVNRAQAQVDLYSGNPTQLQLDQAAANTALAKAQLQDAQRTAAQYKNGVSQQDLATAQAKVQADQATINSANIVAPFSGTVTAVSTQTGDVVKSGDAAFQIDDTSSLFVDLSVSEVDINKVQVGQPVSLTLDAVLNKQYNGKVTEIGTIGTNSSGAVNYTVTVQFSNPDNRVKSGMTASANITVQQKTGVLLVPNLAIQTINNRSIVDVVSNGRVRPAFIQTGLTSDTNTEVVGGNLQAGATVVINPPANLASSFRGNAGPFSGLFRIFGGGGGNRTGGGNFGGGGNFNGGGIRNGTSGGNNSGSRNGGNNSGGNSGGN